MNYKILWNPLEDYKHWGHWTLCANWSFYNTIPCHSSLDKYRKWTYYFCWSTGKIIWNNPTMAHLFIHHEEDVILLLQYFHYTFHQKEDTTSKCLSCLFIQLNNQQLIFPAAGIYCPFLSQNTTEWQEKPVQTCLTHCVLPDISVCIIFLNHMKQDKRIFFS